MDNLELIETFKGLCREIYKIQDADYKTIFYLIDKVDKISTIDLTDQIVKEHCKRTYYILRDHDLWPLFARILKNANKYANYKLIITDGRLLM